MKEVTCQQTKLILNDDELNLIDETRTILESIIEYYNDVRREIPEELVTAYELLAEYVEEEGILVLEEEESSDEEDEEEDDEDEEGDEEEERIGDEMDAELWRQLCGHRV